MFTRDAAGWSQTAKLTASDGAEGEQFGVSIAVDGNTAVVGAWHAVESGFRTGAAYVFTKNSIGWSETAKLMASDGTGGDFGLSVSLDGYTALVGQREDDDLGQISGSAYIFELPESPQNRIQALVEKVVGLNLRRGIERRLVLQLGLALRLLDDDKARNDVWAVYVRRSFIRTVERRGKGIPDADAAALIADALEIIEILRSSLGTRPSERGR